MNKKTVFQLAVSLLAANTFAASSEAYNPSTGYIDAGKITVSSTHLGGYAFSPAIGWISLGNQTDTSAFTYANNSAETYGVNNDGKGNLSGSAWSSSVGWISFGAGTGAAVIDSLSGKFTGWAFNDNIGWISFGGTAQDGSNYGVVSDWKPVEISDEGFAKANGLKPGIYAMENPVTSDKAELIVSTAGSSEIRVVILDPLGNVLDEQTGVTVTSGEPHRFSWNLCDRSGNPVGTGSYLAAARVKDLSTGSVKEFRTVIGVKR